MSRIVDFDYVQGLDKHDLVPYSISHKDDISFLNLQMESGAMDRYELKKRPNTMMKSDEEKDWIGDNHWYYLAGRKRSYTDSTIRIDRRTGIGTSEDSTGG